MSTPQRLEFDSVAEAQDFVDKLELGETPSEERQADLFAKLPDADPESQIMVSRSIRWPAELERAVKQAADADGMSASEWVRRAAQKALAGRDSGTISVDEAVAALRRLPHTI